jgi:hypothetical protein
VLSTYGQQKGLKTTVVLGEPPHGRRVDIEFNDGRRARVLLDQGFGFWRTLRNLPFDFRAGAEAQARQLRGLNTILTSYGETYFVAERLAVREGVAAE